MLHHIANLINKSIDSFFSEGLDGARTSIFGSIAGLGYFAFTPMMTTALHVATGIMVTIASGMLGKLGGDVYHHFKQKYGWFPNNKEEKN